MLLCGLQPARVSALGFLRTAAADHSHSSSVPLSVAQHDSYHAALKHCKHGPWYVDVHMSTAQITWPLFNSLQCFWPGMQMMIGELELGVETLRAFHTLWRHIGFHPEGFNLATMSVQAGQKGYPLRPEHVESLFYAHRTTGGDEWLRAGYDVLQSLERLRVPCGFAAVGDVVNGTLEDKMESFYLSETLKYLFLLFDPDDLIYEHGAYVFSTEAHPLSLDLTPPSERVLQAELGTRDDEDEAAEVEAALAQLRDGEPLAAERGDNDSVPHLFGFCAWPTQKVTACTHEKRPGAFLVQLPVQSLNLTPVMVHPGAVGSKLTAFLATLPAVRTRCDRSRKH